MDKVRCNQPPRLAHPVTVQAQPLVDPERRVQMLSKQLYACNCGYDNHRTDDARAPSRAELKVTEVIALDLHHASAKVRTGPPADTRSDLSLPVWAGQLPLTVSAGDPIPDPRCSVPEPAGLRPYRRGHG